MAIIQYYDQNKHLPANRQHGDVISVQDNMGIFSDGEIAQNSFHTVNGSASEYKSEMCKLSIALLADQRRCGPQFKITDFTKIELNEVDQAIEPKTPAAIQLAMAGSMEIKK